MELTDFQKASLVYLVDNVKYKKFNRGDGRNIHKKKTHDVLVAVGYACGRTWRDAEFTVAGYIYVRDNRYNIDMSPLDIKYTIPRFTWT